ncbi:glycoside hydrolase family 31 protein [Gilvimarinus sp. SDUM040013]|uniref:Glycoside hydrolase family 31 protein n=1 Tax=Gilvimarinus gilvus TaxID=3058038 RepID=A0ABU4S113_9GAMM|nr:TIM-barrel domain-containing protein [Gilvimarinus sp. SDUM040013]MDO3384808.1 glycoside hydrolase family 31 protein [Gilvimarinus sp. SDUM040013]MDX6850859.1 glycoside hydrolase family 31 protein [Gilvimarinus sp. SDUM040013]
MCVHSSIKGAVMLFVLALSSITQADEQWKWGDYGLQNKDQTILLNFRGDTYAEITGFSFNFIETSIDSIKKSGNSLDVTLALASGDGYSQNFPGKVDVKVSFDNGKFRFQTQHDTFNHITITLKDQDEHYFGLIEKLYPANKKNPDLRGQTVDVEVYALGERDYGENYASAYSAFYMSSAGYASFFDSFSKGQYRLGVNGETQIYHQTDALDWYVIHGKDGVAIHQRYYDIIGDPKNVPAWALGPVVWRDHNGGGKDQIIDDLSRFAGLEIPLTATFVDRPYSDGGHKWSKMNFAEGFENPEQWIKTINDDFGMAFMSWVGPMTFGDLDFPGLLPNHRSYIDLTHPAALKEFKHRLTELQYKVGVQGHKMDRADENFPVTAKWHKETSESQSRNHYVYLYSKVIDEFLRSHHGDDQFNFARSAYHRSQPYLSAVWGGDVRPNWQGMASNMANAIRVGFMGFPVWGSDTGGYLGDGRIDEQLYARWLQWSSWSGMFEVKLDGIAGQGEDRPPWKYSKDLQSVFRNAATKRMELLPYNYSLANRSAQQGVLMKPMAYQYLHDENTYTLWDQYVFGDAFLVAPVFTENAKARSIYFPNGKWRSYYEPGKVIQGPATVNWPLVADHIPVFVKAGSIYVTGDVYRGSAKRWQGELSAPELVIHVTPGQAGQREKFEYVDMHDGDAVKPMLLKSGKASLEFTAPELQHRAHVVVYLEQPAQKATLNGQAVTMESDLPEAGYRFNLPAGKSTQLQLSW